MSITSPLLFESHSLERLIRGLSDHLGQCNLFSPPLIVIPHSSMKEWLQIELCKLSTPKSVVGLEFDGWRGALRKLAGPLPIPTCLEVSAALWKELAPSPLSNELKDVFLGMIDGFSSTPEIHELFEKILYSHNWKTYPEALKTIVPSQRKVILFGIDFIPKEILSFFLKHPNLVIFRFSPCAMFWEDFCSHGERKSLLRKWDRKGVSSNKLQALDDLLRDSHRLLANWGMVGRKMVSQLESEGEADYEMDLSQPTRLSLLKQDLLFFEKPSIFCNDDSIRCVKTGASKLQEVEWLHQEIRKTISSGVLPSQIRVYAPDMLVYQPFIQFVFDEIPFRIANGDLGQRSGFYQAILQLFGLVQGRWEAAELITLFQRPSFYRKRKWKLEDVDRMREWIDIGHIRWGVNASHKQETSHVSNIGTASGSWEQGWHEMLDSLFLLQAEKESHIGWGEWEDIQDFYETWVHLAKILLSWKEEKTLAGWVQEIRALIEWALVPDESLESDRIAKSGFADFLEKLQTASHSFPEELFPFSWVETHLSLPSTEMGATFLHAVRFASLEIGAIYPARVIFLIGMDEEAYPRPQRGSFFEGQLKEAPRPSDLDRYTLLQVLFCAKHQLIISYGDASKEDGKAVSPSLLIQELFSYLDTLFPSSTWIQKAERIEPQFLDHTPSLISVTAAPEPEPKETSIRELTKFFRHPLAYYLENVLGLAPLPEPNSPWQDFEPSFLRRHLALSSSLVSGKVSLDDMPLGPFGELAKKNLLEEARLFQEGLIQFGIDPGSIRSNQDGSYVVPQGVLHIGSDDIGGLFRKWPQLMATLAATEKEQIFCLRSGKIRTVLDPKKGLALAIDLFLRCQKSLCFLHAEWADEVLRKTRAPDIDQIRDPAARWILARSPHLNVEENIQAWQSTLASTLAPLITLFGKGHAKI